MWDFPGLTSPFSFQHMISTAEAMFNLNQNHIFKMEDHLKEYGYVPRAEVKKEKNVLSKLPRAPSVRWSSHKI